MLHQMRSLTNCWESLRKKISKLKLKICNNNNFGKNLFILCSLNISFINVCNWFDQFLLFFIKEFIKIVFCAEWL